VNAEPASSPAGPPPSDDGALSACAPAVAAGATLVAVSLGWVLDLHVMAGLALFNEQPLALVAGLAMVVVATTLGWQSSTAFRILAALAALTLFGAMAMVAVRYPQLTMAAMMRPAWLTGLSAAVLLALVVLVWRTIGATIALVVIAFGLAALYGDKLGIPTMAPDRIALYLLLDPNGLLGLPLKVAVEIVIPFILFGELLRQSGGGEYLTRLSLAVFGRYRGGSAKAAIGASSVFGTISGNAVSNVVGTGVVTIPLIKRSGMKATTAGAIEAAASTGGQLLPPVMGAAAFVMADFLRVPYWHVVVAALLPALLYYAALFLQVDRLAARDGLVGIPAGERPPLGPALRGGMHFAVPFVALFVVLYLNQSRPELAALAAVASLLVVGTVVPYEGRRLGIRQIWASLVETGVSSAPLILLTAAAGLIIGLVSLTGLGFSVAADAVAASGGNTFVLLVMVAVIAVIFGMGMPTVAVYVVLATVLAPALEEAGLQPMQAHLFILYFGMMSMLTPPVALASITAAKIAGADPWRTSFEAVKLAWVAYVIPFLFAFSPELLLGGTASGAAIAALTAFLGIAAVSVAVAGYGRGPLGPVVRGLAGVAGLALLLPPVWGLWAAIANAVGAIVFLYLVTRPPASGATGKSRADRKRMKA
jgi:TRAP transporter 4TM/12TM fusion protein